MVNVIGLAAELTLAGILFSGCNTNGLVWDVDGATEIQSRPDVAAIITAHNSATWTQREQRVTSRLNGAKVTAKNIPNWAAWSQQDWATYRDVNVSSTQINAIGNLADAKAMLNKMAVVLDSLAKMEIVLRDQAWPDLPE